MTIDELFDRIERSGGGRTPVHVVMGCSPSNVRAARASGRIPPTWVREALRRLDIPVSPEIEQVLQLAGPWRGPSIWDAER